jgi:rhodanese-related sulfurtransferase
VALQLKRKGIKRVFPLQGGMEAWMSAGYDVANEAVEVLPGSKPV